MNLRPFEIILIAVFGIAAIAGIAALSMYEPAKTEEDVMFGDRVQVWGSVDSYTMNTLISEIGRSNDAFKVVRYTQIDARDFTGELLSAIAEGNSPDLIIMPHSSLVSLRSKLRPISYETLPERDFKDRYIDGAQIFMMQDGIYGIPLMVDPLVMYWNRDLFSSGGLANPPRTWEALVNETTPALTRSDEQLKITQSAVALGEYGNVEYAKEVLSMLLLQAGSTLVEESGTGYKITLNDTGSASLPPGNAVVTFYTQFVAPASLAYTWNRSMPPDRTQFLTGKLGMFFAPGSERDRIAKANPNLDFDIAQVPQGGGATVYRNYADFYAFAIPRASQNPQGARLAAEVLASPESARVVAEALDMAPVHRSLIQAGSNDTYERIIFASALIARGWLDPSPRETDEIFRYLIEEVSSGRARVEGAISDAVGKIRLLFR